MILSTDDGLRLRNTYADKLEQILAMYGLTMRISPRRPEGKALFLKSKEVGTLAFEQPLDQEKERKARQKMDEYTLETVPVFVCNGADALLEVRIDGS